MLSSFYAIGRKSLVAGRTINLVEHSMQPMAKLNSNNGFIPITFTLFTLHAVDMVSWYLFIHSAFTVATSTATLVDLGNFSPSQVDMKCLSQQSTLGRPAFCSNYDMLVYCLSLLHSDYYISQSNDDLSSTDPCNRAYNVLGFCLVVLVALILKEATAFEKLPSIQTSSSLLKTLNFMIANFVGIRGIQLALSTNFKCTGGIQ